MSKNVIKKFLDPRKFFGPSHDIVLIIVILTQFDSLVGKACQEFHPGWQNCVWSQVAKMFQSYGVAKLSGVLSGKTVSRVPRDKVV